MAGGRAVRGSGFGLVGDSAIGIVGALHRRLASASTRGSFGSGIFGLTINATIGANSVTAGSASDGSERMGKSIAELPLQLSPVGSRRLLHVDFARRLEHLKCANSCHSLLRRERRNSILTVR